MSLIPHSMLPRSCFNTDNWFKPMMSLNQQSLTPTTWPNMLNMDTTMVPFVNPTTLDMFDPFDELDHAVARNMQWLNKPEFIKPFDFPTVPQKYRITVDIFGYSPKSIKTEWKDGKLVVCGKEEVKHEGDDFSIKEFKKTYELPANAEHEKFVSFVTSHGQLVIEVPLKEAPLSMNAELFPQVMDTMEGGKQVWMNCTLPKHIDPKKIHISCKDRDIIIRAEDITRKPDGISKFHYYKKSTMPVNTNWDELKCTFDNDVISIKAPLDLEFKPHHSHKHVPIENLKHAAITSK